MTLDQILKLQSIIDKRAIRCDTLRFLDEKRFSESKQSMIRYGDMHIDHFLKVFVKSEVGSEIFKSLKQRIVKEFGSGNN
jgi:hypothetical protein